MCNHLPTAKLKIIMEIISNNIIVISIKTYRRSVRNTRNDDVNRVNGSVCTTVLSLGY